MSRPARIEREPIPPGTLDMLILKTVERERELHGFEIAEWIQRGSRDVLRVEEGSLYPALQRLVVRGWLVGEWGHTTERRRAKYYRLTPSGHRQVEREIESYRRVSNAIELLLQPT